MKTPRKVAVRREVGERVHDWREVYPGTPGEAVLPFIEQQASRCMDCGVPFCHFSCPLGNLIPEWNDLIWRDEWQAAAERLHATNNFPEFTGRLCPALCEAGCVLGSVREPVTIRNAEVAIIDKAWSDLRVTPISPDWHTLRTIAVVGSGPAGLAAAQQLTRAGHTVVVYERDDAPGGLLRYGIPAFKLEKQVVDRRIKQMVLEGTTFKTNTHIGRDITGAQLVERFDAVVLATGATKARDLDVPGRALPGVHQAMEYLTKATKALSGPVGDPIDAAGLRVVVIGGGDTGADCVGTALRQGAASVTSLEIMPQPPVACPANQPWPTYPSIQRTSSSAEEGSDKLFSVSTLGFVADAAGALTGVEVVDVDWTGSTPQPIPGTQRVIDADLVCLALGFLGPEQDGLVNELGLQLDERGNIARDSSFATSVPGVFACGDCGRGQSLIVWAIAEGRSAANGVDSYLQGHESALPKPICPDAALLRV
jgi:glutamate synthase (NADPH/NADH) small chain